MKALRKALIAVLVTLLVVLVVAEIGARMIVSNKLAQAFEDDATSQGLTVPKKPKVHFGPHSALAAVLTHQASLTMDTPSTVNIQDTTIKGTPESHLDIRKLTLDDNAVAQHLTSETTADPNYLSTLVKRKMGSVTSVAPNGKANTLEVQVSQGLATLSVTPIVSNGQLKFQATAGKVFGFDVPQSLVEGVSSALQDGVPNQGNLRITQAKVVDGGLQITLEGDNVSLREVSRYQP